MCDEGQFIVWGDLSYILPPKDGRPILFRNSFKEHSIGNWSYKDGCFVMQCAPPMVPFTEWMDPSE